MTDARPLVIFIVAALALALTAGFGLGLWLLLARTLGVPTFGLVWASLVQVHGFIQLFGFAALFLMGVGLQVVPRFRGAPRVPNALFVGAFVPTMLAILLRAFAQPSPDLPQRDVALVLSGPLLVAGTGVFAVTAIRALARGTNPHRPDEIVMAVGIAAAPTAAVLLAIATPNDSAVLVVDQGASDRATWTMLLGSLATVIFGVWARLAPAFVATPPPRWRTLIVGSGLWTLGVAALVSSQPFAGALLLAGVCLVALAVGVFGPSIARQPLAGHARLTRAAVRSAFIWAIVGALLLAYFGLRGVAGEPADYLELSAARHAFALGLVTLMIYAVAARALPSFTGRRLWSERLQLATIAVANAAVPLRVVPELADWSWSYALVALSGVLAYVALMLFAVNVVRTLRSRPSSPSAAGSPIPIAVRFGAPPTGRAGGGGATTR